MNTVIVYAVNDSPKHFFMLKKSITSLRKHNTDIPIKVCSFTNGATFEQQALEMVGLADKVEMVHVLGTVRLHLPHSGKVFDPTLLKWHAICHFNHAERILFLDADTYVLGDVQKFLDAHQTADFYAREECGTEADGKHRLIGNVLMQHQLDRGLYDRICERLKSLPAFVPNTGVMILNRTAIANVNPSLVEFYTAKFKRGEYAYPSTNRHIVEEIAASLQLGRGLGDFKMERLGWEWSPFFIEYLDEARSVFGGWDLLNPPIPTIVHSWSAYYPYMLAWFESISEARKMPGAENYSFGEE